MPSVASRCTVRVWVDWSPYSVRMCVGLPHGVILSSRSVLNPAKISVTDMAGQADVMMMPNSRRLRFVLAL
jgi:hypothetical protein